MSIIRSILPKQVNDTVWFAVGRVMTYYKYYVEDPKVFDANLVYPGIYIGDLSSSINKEELQKRNIVNILSVLNGCTENYPELFRYKIIHVNDDDWIDISEYFDEAVEFIDESLNKNENILVHCSKGVSRSVTIVLAFLMKKKNMTLENALNQIKTNRSVANPNNGFLEQLRNYSESE